MCARLRISWCRWEPQWPGSPYRRPPRSGQRSCKPLLSWTRLLSVSARNRSLEYKCLPSSTLSCLGLKILESKNLKGTVVNCLGSAIDKISEQSRCAWRHPNCPWICCQDKVSYWHFSHPFISWSQFHKADKSGNKILQKIDSCNSKILLQNPSHTSDLPETSSSWMAFK